MRYGIACFPTDYSMTPADLARAAEERGFESLWVAEHSHIPCSRRSPYPGGGDLPKMYYDVMDPFVALATAASVTRTIRLGTGVCLVVQRDPIQTAKEVASLDRLSGGRVLFGVGGGWNEEEMADHGTDPRTRWKLLRERIEAMKAIWTQKQAAYQGDLVRFEPLYAWPKPVQQPHPPIHVGGRFPHGLRRAVRYGDGWIPLAGRGDSDIVRLMPEVRTALAAAGRPADAFEVSVYAAPGDADLIATYRDAGVARVIFFAPPSASDVVLPLLDAYAATARSVG